VQRVWSNPGENRPGGEKAKGEKAKYRIDHIRPASDSLNLTVTHTITVRYGSHVADAAISRTGQQTFPQDT